MISASWLWVVFTVLAAAGQTARNAMQRELTTTLGTVGATHVRFLFGFPFALLFLLGVALATGAPLPRPSLSFIPWLLVGALFQIGATATMLAATFTLACGLVLQAALLTAYLALRDRAVLAAIAAQWRRSLFAGFMGATASEFWFLAFALATAASVRTLALVEVLFAQAISAFIFKQPTSPREGIGMAMIVIGVVM